MHLENNSKNQLLQLLQQIENICERKSSDREYNGDIVEDIRNIINPIESDIVFNREDALMLEDIKERKFPLMDFPNIIYQQNIINGWWNDLYTGKPLVRNRKEILGLIESEIFESFEGERKGHYDKHLPKRLNSEVEIADFVIRIFDYAGKFNIDVFSFFIMQNATNGILEEMKKIDSFLPTKNKVSLINAVEKANLKGIPFYIEQVEQFKAYQAYCYQKTNIGNNGKLKNRFESLFAIGNEISKCSDLVLPSPNAELKTFDEKIEERQLSKALAMMLDFSSYLGYDIGTTIIEKFTYNVDRKDHSKKERKEKNGKEI